MKAKIPTTIWNLPRKASEVDKKSTAGSDWDYVFQKSDFKKCREAETKLHKFLDGEGIFQINLAVWISDYQLC